jgi:VWFA-related protein
MSLLKISSSLLIVLVLSEALAAQSGRGATPGRRSAVLNVIINAPADKTVTKDMLDLYDSGIPQEIESFGPVEAGSRIIFMVDNSQNLKVEPAVLRKAATAIVNELYEDDQMMVVGFNEAAEIIEDLTPDLPKLQAAVTKFVRKGFPRLFDALIAVTDALSHQAQTGVEKRAIILISDGYDSGSQTKFDAALKALQNENIVVYALQAPDRTRGALLRDKPKPPVALDALSGGTGGAIFPVDKAADAAKAITEDLRKKWYRLTYTPSGVNTLNTRRLLLISNEPGIQLRTKRAQPGRYD